MNTEKVHTVVIESEQRLFDGDVSTRKERQILGEKRGRGTTVMRVHEIADLFKTMPKRKQIHENLVVESPSKKPRTNYLESHQLKQNIVQIFEDFGRNQCSRVQPRPSTC